MFFLWLAMMLIFAILMLTAIARFLVNPLVRSVLVDNKRNFQQVKLQSAKFVTGEMAQVQC